MLAMKAGRHWGNIWANMAYEHLRQDDMRANNTSVNEHMV